MERAQKFGLVTKETLEQKRMERAVKFGVVPIDDTTPQSMRKVTSSFEPSQGKLKSRAERFNNVATVEQTAEQIARAERFGINRTVTAEVVNDKKRQRSDRFRVPNETGRVITNNDPNKRLKLN